MITAVTLHALARMQERHNVQHPLRHINKVIRSLNDNKALVQETDRDGAVIIHRKRWRYVVREGVLVTVLPPARNKDREGAA